MESDDEGRSGKGRPDAMDLHVGSRIRLRRMSLKMSQEQLAEALGLTFQQIQKYERGTNRVAASRLWDLGRVLDVPIGFFYDDAPANLPGPYPSAFAATPARRPGLAEAQEAFGSDELGELMRRRETQDLVRAYYRITDEAVRRRVFDLIKSLAPAETPGA